MGSQPLDAKLRDSHGLLQLAGQVVVDLAIMTLVYLPMFYLFKTLFFGDCHAAACVGQTKAKFLGNFAADFPALVKCWGPADLACFSVPLYLRIPIRHLVSFCWTIYFSFVRGSSH